MQFEALPACGTDQHHSSTRSSVVVNPWSGPINSDSHTHCVSTGSEGSQGWHRSPTAWDRAQSQQPDNIHTHTHTHSCSPTAASSRRGIRSVALCQGLGERGYFGWGISGRADPDAETLLLLWEADSVLQISPRTLHCHSATSHKPDLSSDTQTALSPNAGTGKERKGGMRTMGEQRPTKLPLTLSEAPTLNLAWKVQQGWRREPAWKARNTWMHWDQELEDEEKGKKGEEVENFSLSLGWKKLKCFQGQTQYNSTVILAYESLF